MPIPPQPFNVTVEPDKQGLPLLRYGALVIVVFAFLCLLVWTFLIVPLGPLTFFDDGGTYLMMARALAFGGESLHSLADSFRVLPGLYPLVIGAVAANAEGLIAAARLTNVLATMVVWLCCWWLAFRLLQPGRALLALLVILSLPVAWFMSPAVVSEPVFTALTMLSLAIADALVSTRHWSRWLALAAFVLGLCLIGSILTRTIGIALIPAIVAMLWQLQHRLRLACYLGAGLLVAMVVAVGYGLPWTGSGYGGHVLAKFNDFSLSQAATFALSQCKQMLAAFLANLTLIHEPERMFALWLVGGGLFFWVIWSLLRHALALNPIAIYVVTSLLIVLIWPFPDHMVRFLYPLMPVTIILALRSTAGQMTVFRTLVASCFVLMAGLGYGRFIDRSLWAGAAVLGSSTLYAKDNAEKAQYEAFGFVNAINDWREFRYLLPKDARVVCFKPHYFEALSGRSCVLPPLNLSADWITQQAITHAYLSPLTRPDRPADLINQRFDGCGDGVWQRHNGQGHVEAALVVIDGCITPGSH